MLLWSSRGQPRRGYPGGGRFPFLRRAVSRTDYPGERLYCCFGYIYQGRCLCEHQGSVCVLVCGLRFASLSISFSPSLATSHVALQRYLCDTVFSLLISTLLAGARTPFITELI